MTLLLVLVLVVLLVVGVVAMSYWISEGGCFGWFMAWNMIDGIGHIFAALLGAVASCFNQD